jgi:tRNA A37 methylthiotransferase MiaB
MVAGLAQPARSGGDHLQGAIGTQLGHQFAALGCPKALVDSERILTQLRAEGYDIVAGLRRRRPGGGQHLRLHRRAVEESLDAIGEALAENGKVIVTGCLGAKEERDPRGASAGAGDHRPARDYGER